MTGGGGQFIGAMLIPIFNLSSHLSFCQSLKRGKCGNVGKFEKKNYHFIHMQIYQNVITKEEMNDLTMKWWTERIELNQSLSPASGL